jgi:hypothetical protein
VERTRGSDLEGTLRRILGGDGTLLSEKRCDLKPSKDTLRRTIGGDGTRCSREMRGTRPLCLDGGGDGVRKAGVILDLRWIRSGAEGIPKFLGS